MDGWVPRMSVWTGGDVKAVCALASGAVGAVGVPAAAWECSVFDVLVDVSTFPHQAGSKDRVRSTGVVDLVLAFFVLLEGDFAFRFAFLGFFAWLIVDLDCMLELLPLTLFFLAAVA